MRLQPEQQRPEKYFDSPSRPGRESRKHNKTNIYLYVCVRARQGGVGLALHCSVFNYSAQHGNEGQPKVMLCETVSIV